MPQQLSKERKKLLTLVSVGLMAALVFVGNYMQIKIPVAIGDITRVHLGNSMCLLAGLLFGPSVGGLASGIGAGLYDMLDPVYIVSAPYTFCSKFAMGFLAGLLNRYFLQKEGSNKLAGSIISGVVGQITYIFLYLFKSYVSLILLGTTSQAALVAVVPKIATSSINAVAAVVISVPLYFALSTALSHNGFFSLMHEKKESRGYWNPVTVTLTIFCCATTLLFSLYLSNVNKQKAEQEKKDAAVQSQLEDYQQKLDFLSEQLDLSFPEPESSAEPAE